jgi:outer membrane receptor protein involved in Fe transport
MHASRRVLAFLTLVTLFAFTTPWAFSQGIVTGSLSGTVVDQSGAAVAGASVIATESQTNRTMTAKTNAQGAWQIPQVPPGIYNIKINAANFEGVQYQSVQVNVGRDTSSGIAKLKVGGEQQTVTVEGAAPLVETNSIQMQETFTAKQTADLPLAGGFDQLALFVPGVVSTGGSNFSNTNGAEISVNGQRGRSNNFQIDGQANNDNSVAGPSIFFGNQDAIAELQVITNYTAEYGHNMGSVVNYVTKSGTNAFHGTGYEYYQGSTFDSLSNAEKSAFPLFSGPNGGPFCAPGVTAGTLDLRFTDANGNPGVPCEKPVVPRFVDNRFGGTVGGPILKNKLWFFGSTNWERQRVGSTPSTLASGRQTPTPEGIAALAAALPGNPAVAALQQFGPFAITQGNPVATGVTNRTVTLPNGSTLVVPFGGVTRNISSLFNDKEATGRVDAQITNKDRFFGRYVFQQQLFTGIAGNGVALGDFVDLPGRDQQMGLDWTRTWTNTILDQNRFSYSRVNFGFEGGAHPDCTITSVNNCPPQISFGAPAPGATPVDTLFGVATNLPQGRIINVYQYQNNANWQRGRHSIKVGGEYDKQRSPNVFLPTTNGAFTFSRGNGRSPFENFLANTPSSVNIALGSPTFSFKENDLAFYGQDDWRIKDNLTLNLGLRWEWYSQIVNLIHDETVANQTSSRPFWDPTLPLSATTVPSVPEDKNNFGPVFGFAWTPRIWQGLFGQEKTVIRGGFRIAYDPSFYNIALNVQTSAPAVNRATLSGSTLPPGSAAGLPTGTITGTTVQGVLQPLVPQSDPRLRSQTTVSPNFHNPYSQQWNFGIQRQVSNRVAAEARYVGNHTVGNFQNINANPALTPFIQEGFANVIPAGLTPCATPGAPGFASGRADCNFTNVTQRNNGAFSIYHSLQTELRIQNWHGFQGNATYTFSKLIDNASEIFSVAGQAPGFAVAQNPFDVNRGERGLSSFDFPHNFAIALIYNLPFANGQQGLLGKIAGGWQWNVTYRYNSGQPYTTAQFNQGSNQFGTSVCDPNAFFSTTFDQCRPILSSPSAPFTSVGRCTDPTAPNCGLTDLNTGNPINAAHWIINDLTAAQFFGTPFAGAGRNLQRGDSVNAVNMGLFKNTKVNERVNLRLELTVFNPFNIQYKGIPDLFVDDAFDGGPTSPPTFGSVRANDNGNGAPNSNANGTGIRRLQLGAKIIF